MSHRTLYYRCIEPRFNSIGKTNGFDPYDVVIILHGGGWFEELRSNRWHFASHFAKSHKVLVAEASTKGAGTLVSDVRIPNLEVLKIEGVRPLVDSPAKSAELIRQRLSQIGARHPVLWLSSPLLWNVAVCLEEMPVVFHATEDFVRLAAYNPHPFSSYILDCALEAARSSDATLCCSAGVTASIAEALPSAHLITGSNGVSLADYGPEQPQEFVDVGDLALTSCAIFAGNINKRLDFGLLFNVAREISQLTLLLVGPVVLDAKSKKSFEALLSLPNVKHLPPLETPSLNYLYTKCVLGIVPYTSEPVIANSGFPLKTLEMVASGLPVVTTHLDQTHGISETVACCHSSEEFVHHCRQILNLPRRIQRSDPHIADLLNRYSYQSLIPWSVDQVTVQILAGSPKPRRKVFPKPFRVFRDTLESVNHRVCSRF